MKFQGIVDIIDAVSPLITMRFGVFAATRDTKPKNGTLTRDGRIAIWGIILSASFTIIVKISNVYNKNIQQDKQNELNIIAEQKKRTEDSINLVFQRSVDSSFIRSIYELKKLDSAARLNIKITRTVNAAAEKNLAATDSLNKDSKKKFDLSQHINTQTTGVLDNTDRVLNPLFPLCIVITFRIKASTQQCFWDYMARYRESKEDPFLPRLDKQKYLAFKKENPEQFEELQNLLRIKFQSSFRRPSTMVWESMVLNYAAVDSILDFTKFSVRMDFDEKSLVILLKTKFQRPSYGKTQYWKGERDLVNSYFTINVWSNSPIQLESAILDHGVPSAGWLYGTCFFEGRHTDDASWIGRYQAVVGPPKSNREDLCTFRKWLLYINDNNYLD